MGKALLLSGLAGFLLFLAFVSWEHHLDPSLTSLIVVVGALLLFAACFPVLLKMLVFSSLMLIVGTSAYIVYTQLSSPATNVTNGLPNTDGSNASAVTEPLPNYGEASKDPMLTVDIHARESAQTPPTEIKTTQ